MVLDSIPNVIGVKAGKNHVAYLSEDGKLYMIGSNWNNQLGPKGSRVITLNVYPLEFEDEILDFDCGGNFTICLTK
jgi:alpha-tubulin suppressor-like RCC1 family protein